MTIQSERDNVHYLINSRVVIYVVLEELKHGILVLPSLFYWKMEGSYKKLNTQWPIWEIIATAAAG